MEKSAAMSAVHEIEQTYNSISIDIPKSLNAVQELLHIRKRVAIDYKKASGDNEIKVLKEYMDFLNNEIKLILAI
jgi:hypothetical protein